MFINHFIKYFALVVLISTVESAKLNVPRILLPVFNNVHINYTLEVTEGGCYSWSVSRLDLVMLNPEISDRKLGCSTKVVITAISREKSRNTAIVLAEDVLTKNILRCDVILDVIDKLAIVTTTRELFVEEAPEAFEVEAYDAHGNQFSTLEGVEFSWSVSQISSSQPSYTSDSDNNLSSGSVQITHFFNSPYETPSSVSYFDNLGRYGHIALIEGLNTGSVIITVKLAQAEYSHIKPLEVPLLVVANLILQPAEVYITQGDTISLKVLQVKKGHVHKVDLRHGQYYLQAENESIIKLDGAYITGNNFGVSKVFVKDHNSRVSMHDLSNDKSMLPEGKVTVTYPDKLRLTLQPYDNWLTIVGKKYTIAAELYTKNDQRMHMGDGVRIKITVNQDLFGVVSQSLNGSLLEGIPLKRGVLKVYAELLHIEGPDGKIFKPTKLTATAEMLIFDQITLNPSEVILPWDPLTLSRFEIQLAASGGDGDFIWSSNDPSIAAVSQHGLVTTLSLGFSKIKAAMSRNLQNYETADVYIIKPVDLQIVDYVLEVPVGSELKFHIAVFGVKQSNELDNLEIEDKIPFSDCTTLPFKVKFDENNFIVGGSGKPEQSTIGISCACLTIKAVSPGVSTVTVSYDVSNGQTLYDTVTVSSFKPLKVLEPESATTVLSIGSSRNLIFIGGPRPLSGRPNEHVYAITANEHNKLEISENTEHTSAGRSGIYVYNVLCHEVGAYTVVFSVGNKPTLVNCHHNFSEIKVSVLCALPRSIHLVPVMNSQDPASCPIDINSESLVQHNYKDINIEIEVRDNMGRKFDNITSFKIDWKINPCQLSSCNELQDFQSLVKYVHGVEVPDKVIQIIPTHGKSGTLKVHSNLQMYKTQLLKSLHITPEWPVFGIENENGVLETPIIHDSITLYLARDTEINPANITLFNHPDNKGLVHVNQGSGYYELRLTSDKIAKVNYDNVKHELTIEPKSKGNLRIDLVDLCLSSETPSVYVNIVSIQKILVDMPDRVEKGQCIKAIVKLLDEFDRLMPVPEERLLNLRYAAESDIINMKLAPRDPLHPWGVGEVHFIISGLEIGNTKLRFTTGHGDRLVQSDLESIQVFSPLKLSPRNMTLIVGSSMQIHLMGGPTADLSVEFITEKDKIADVKSGVVMGLAIGHTRVTGRAVGFNPAMGAMVTYSQDTIDVYVIPLSGIKIHTHLVQIEVGAVVPFWISGSPDSISPMILGSRNPPLKVSWEIAGPDNGVAAIRNVFHNTGLDNDDINQISVRLVAVRPGKVQIKANLTVPSPVGIWRTDSVLSSEIELDVITPLRLINPYIESNHILIAPNTKIDLQTNKQTKSHTKYTVQTWQSLTSNSSSPSELHVSQSGVLEVIDGPGIGLLLISTKDEKGMEQNLGIVVECKPVHYIMTDIASPLKLMQRRKKLPRGLSVTMAVTHFDNLGRKMFASLPNVAIELNRADISNVVMGRDNKTFHVDLLLPGDTMLMVTNNGEGTRQLVDYVKLTVSDSGLSIFNHSSFTVGDVVCFSTQLAVNDGRWFTSDSLAVNIDGKTGIARMLKETTASVTIMFALNDVILYKVDVTIVPIQKIVFLSTDITYFTGDVMNVEFILNSEAGNYSSNMICDENCIKKSQFQLGFSPDLFSCQLSVDEYGANDFLEKIHTAPSFNFTSGRYSCELSSNNLVTNAYSESSITLTVRSGFIESTFKRIKLLPPVQVTPKEISMRGTGSTFITITGHDLALNKISIVLSDPKSISVDKYSASRGQIRYKVQIKNYEYANIVAPKISIFFPVTNQQFKIPVNLKEVSEFCYLGSGSPIIYLLYYYRYPLMFLTTVLALIIGSVYLQASKSQKKVCTGHPGVTCDPNCPAHLDKANPGLFNKSSQRMGYNTIDNLQAAHNSMNERSIGGSPRLNSSTLLNDSGPVYGDSSYYSSPEARRNRRFI